MVSAERSIAKRGHGPTKKSPVQAYERDIWSTLDRIQRTLSLSTKELARLMTLSERQLNDCRKAGKCPSALAVMNLSKKLHVDYGAIIEGRLNLSHIARQ